MGVWVRVRVRVRVRMRDRVRVVVVIAPVFGVRVKVRVRVGACWRRHSSAFEKRGEKGVQMILAFISDVLDKDHEGLGRL